MSKEKCTHIQKNKITHSSELNISSCFKTFV